ncbi:MAG: hypothetical protein AB1690_01020 [Candidatus Zixiibacteriota bacterium]
MINKLIITMAAAVLFLSSCEEKISSVDSSSAPMTVSGTLYAWRCGIRDWFNNNLQADNRFYTRTGDSAAIRFFAHGKPPLSTFTDQNSRFEFSLDAGIYNIEYLTGYSWPPDTIYDVSIASDTTIVLDMVLRSLDPLYLCFEFTYNQYQDTLRIDEDWNCLKKLNQFMGGVLDIQGLYPPKGARTWFVLERQNSISIYIYYRVPIRRDRIHLGQALEIASRFVYSNMIEFEPIKSVNPCGSMIPCLAM